MSEKVKKILWYVAEIGIVLLIISLIWGYFSRKLDVSEQNLKAATTELKETKLKNGELLTSKNSYIATIDDLNNLLDISKKEVKELQRKLDSKIAYISQIESNVKIEYIEIVKDSIVYVDNTPKKAIAPFHYNDQWVNLNGENEFTFGDTFDYRTKINEISMNVPLTVGLTDDYQIFVKSPNPYFNISSIEGAVIDKSKLYPKKKRFNWGLQGGMGVMYDFIDRDIAAGLYLGIGAEFNF